MKSVWYFLLLKVPKSSHVFEHEIEIVGMGNLHHKCLVIPSSDFCQSPSLPYIRVDFIFLIANNDINRNTLGVL